MGQRFTDRTTALEPGRYFLFNLEPLVQVVTNHAQPVFAQCLAIVSLHGRDRLAGYQVPLVGRIHKTNA